MRALRSAGLSCALCCAAACAQILDIDHDYRTRPGAGEDAGADASGQTPPPDADTADGAALPELDGGLDGSAEGGADGSADANLDGDIEAGPVESDGAVLDGGPDGGAPDAAGFCESYGVHLVCDDFDQVPPQVWEEISTVGSQQLDGTEFRSAPSSYVASTDVLATGEQGQVSRQQTFPGPISGYRFEFSVRVDERGGNSGVALAAVTTEDAQTGLFYSAGLVSLGSTVVFEDIWQPSRTASETRKQYRLTRGIATGQWLRVVTDVSLAPSGATVTLLFDDELVLDRVRLQITELQGDTRAAIGITQIAGPAPAWSVRYDDVVFDLR